MYKLIDIIDNTDFHKIFGGSIKIYLYDLEYFIYDDIIFNDKQVIIKDNNITLYGEIDYLLDIKFYGYTKIILDKLN